MSAEREGWTTSVPRVTLLTPSVKDSSGALGRFGERILRLCKRPGFGCNPRNPRHEDKGKGAVRYGLRKC